MELLNLQRVNNIGILLSQFKVPLEEVIGAIWRMDESALSLENLKALRYIAPKDDEVFLDPVAPTTHHPKHSPPPPRFAPLRFRSRY
jgi:hypothetical protein